MGKTKARGKYQSVSLSVDFVKEIKNHIIDNPKYKSIADYVRESVRERMVIDNAIKSNPPPMRQQIVEKYVNDRYNLEYKENPEVDTFIEEYIDDKFRNEFHKVMEKKFENLFKKAIDRKLREEKKQKKEKNRN